MRFECGQFLPRMCEGTVRVYEPGVRVDAPLAFEHRVKVRRVSMISHEPIYALGLSFIDPEPELEQQVGHLLRLVVQAQSEAIEGGDDA